MAKENVFDFSKLDIALNELTQVIKTKKALKNEQVLDVNEVKIAKKPRKTKMKVDTDAIKKAIIDGISKSSEKKVQPEIAEPEQKINSENDVQKKDVISKKEIQVEKISISSGEINENFLTEKINI